MPVDDVNQRVWPPIWRQAEVEKRLVATSKVGRGRGCRLSTDYQEVGLYCLRIPDERAKARAIAANRIAHWVRTEIWADASPDLIPVGPGLAQKHARVKSCGYAQDCRRKRPIGRAWRDYLDPCRTEPEVVDDLIANRMNTARSDKRKGAPRRCPYVF